MTFYTLHRRSELRSDFVARLLAGLRAASARFAKGSPEPSPTPAAHDLGSLQAFAMMLRN
ncbi:hypothetical protein GCM10007036_22590 [Alsobacter metallidurans]|uniref:Uncharacterized protein n=1 Tax=Alsobacter metallidurans TaxID=340221 RepID=A0A917I768_9HYPH|nr:hypothetical protein [Alsobacter metallidurans]GGH19587.1 hypothetical protein GCM10007036_22590 [Alsobacter metallidurans]